jgi:hypothetical protein
MQMESQMRVFSVSVKDKALLNDFSTDDLADIYMESCGFTEA